MNQPLKKAQPLQVPIDLEASKKSYKALLYNVFSLLDSYVGRKIGAPEIWQTKPDDMEMLTAQGAEVMVEFAPVIDSKWTKLAGFGIIAGGIYGAKYYATLDLIEKSMTAQENKPHDAV